MDQKLSFEECIQAIKYNKSEITDPLVKEIICSFETLIEKFKPLLKHFIGKGKISSPELSKLWLFFTEGNLVKMTSDKLIADYLKKPVFNLKNETSLIVKYPFLYQAFCSEQVTREKITYILKLKKLGIYDSDNPIDWFKKNKNSFVLPEFKVSESNIVINNTLFLVTQLDPIHRQ